MSPLIPSFASGAKIRANFHLRKEYLKNYSSLRSEILIVADSSFPLISLINNISRIEEEIYTSTWRFDRVSFDE